MIPGRLGLAINQENPLWISWHDSNWIPILNPANVMDYFSEKSNPFYDRTCNNEIVKMQRQSVEHLHNMVGVEYILLHVQDPILYVIRKQHRHSPTEATPVADYYIIAGTVYQAPDLASVFNSRLLSSVHHLQVAFEEASSYSRYHPSKGYFWDFTSNKALTDKSKVQTKKENGQSREEPSSSFQRQRVDMLLGELLRKFPLTISHPTQASNQAAVAHVKVEKTEIKQELVDHSLPNGSNENGSAGSQEKKNEMKPPLEKKIKL